MTEVQQHNIILSAKILLKAQSDSIWSSYNACTLCDGKKPLKFSFS